MKKRKRLFLPMLLVSAALSGAFTVPAYASEAPNSSHNYQFNSGPDTTATFGSPTMTDVPRENPLTENVRRNKDAAYLPPGYGTFSGELPTNPSSLYHSADSPASASNTTNNGSASVNYYGDTTGTLQSTSIIQPADTTVNSGGVSVNYLPDALPGAQSNTATTQPAYYDNGSIGFLSIPAINTYVQVYEGETTANLKLGAAHFEETSAWDGNIGLAGHNRGAHDFFRGVKDLKIGDLITYETKYGTRTYQVYLKEQIYDTDFSYLGQSRENIISLITCVIDTPDRRWAIQAREIK